MSKTVVHVIHDLRAGGTERRMLALLRSLDPERYRPILVCVDGLGELAEEAAESGIEPVVLGRGARWDVSGVFRLARLVREEQASVVHGWLFLANVFARVGGRLGRAPVVLAAEGGAITTRSASRRRVARTVETVLGPVTNAYVANSEATAVGMRALGVPARKIETIHNGVAVAPRIDEGERARLRSSVQASDGEPLVAMVARVDPEFKDHESFLHSIAALPGVRAAVVGDGPGLVAAEALAKQLGIEHRVTFTGFRRDAARLMAAADVSVLLTYSEGLSNVLLESMAAGVPVVATDISPNREALRDGVDGLLVPVRDPAATAAAIQRLLTEPATAASFVSAARTRVADAFSIEAQADRTMALYDRLLRTKRR
jgi:glycosyltransferase involved in cell wall biosynthesis